MFLSYRDPLFGIIIFFLLIFVVSALTYIFGKYKEKRARMEYRKLLNRFEHNMLNEKDYTHLYEKYDLPFDSIILLASTFLHKGDYNKAISVYLKLLKVVSNVVHKEELLELLGATYYKGGFFQRSKNIFLKILQFAPKNEKALYHLLIINEKLKDYDSATDVINVLFELSKATTLEKTYIEILKETSNSVEVFDDIMENLWDILESNKAIQRLIASYIIKNDLDMFWKNINKFETTKLIDLLWYLKYDDLNFEVINNDKFLQELYTAKGYINDAIQSNIFELNILIKLNNTKSNIATLAFNFICNKCKKNHPIYESRCPSCNKILTHETSLKIIKKTSSSLDSFL